MTKNICRVYEVVTIKLYLLPNRLLLLILHYF